MTDAERLAQIRIDAVNSDRTWEEWGHDIHFLIAQLDTAQAEAQVKEFEAAHANDEYILAITNERDTAQAEAERLRGEVRRCYVHPDFSLTDAMDEPDFDCEADDCGIRVDIEGFPLDPDKPHTGEFCADPKGEASDG